jgi:predicted TIM-barrel fold metal-dependent hydrolase
MITDFRKVVPYTDFLSREEIEKSFTDGYMSGYTASYGKGSIMSQVQLTEENMLQDMEESGTNYAVLQGEWDLGDYRKQNDAVYNLARKHPDKFVAHYLCLNPAEDDDMVRVIEREVKDRGFKGVNLQPWAHRLYANDKRFYPVYDKCQELCIPVTIHTSINFTTNRSIDYGRPIYLDEIACTFPQLIIVANHGGWPWVNELVAVAWKHRNVYIEIGAISPKYIGTVGSGWETLITYGNTLLQDQVLFATDNMLPLKRCVDELNALPLKDSVKEKWLGKNAAHILALDKEHT